MARHDIALRARKSKALQAAIDEAGGPSEMARFISVKYAPITVQAISMWTVCPPQRAGQVAAAAQAKGGKTTVADLCPEFAKIFAPKLGRKETEATT
jgi:hypothetical protein